MEYGVITRALCSGKCEAVNAQIAGSVQRIFFGNCRRFCLSVGRAGIPKSALPRRPLTILYPIFTGFTVSQKMNIEYRTDESRTGGVPTLPPRWSGVGTLLHSTFDIRRFRGSYSFQRCGEGKVPRNGTMFLSELTVLRPGIHFDTHVTLRKSGVLVNHCARNIPSLRDSLGDERLVRRIAKAVGNTRFCGHAHWKLLYRPKMLFHHSCASNYLTYNLPRFSYPENFSSPSHDTINRLMSSSVRSPVQE